MEYAWFNNVETKPGIGYPKTGRTGISGKAAGSAALAVS
nr:Respiratory nitrate reductase 2 beta chain [Klebsiella pneumoniae]